MDDCSARPRSTTATRTLLGAHLLSIVRETWAIGPSFTNLKGTGIRPGPDSPDEHPFDVEVDRATADWHDDHTGAPYSTAGSQPNEQDARGSPQAGGTAT